MSWPPKTKPRIRYSTALGWHIPAPRVCCYFVGETPDAAYLKWLKFWSLKR